MESPSLALRRKKGICTLAAFLLMLSIGCGRADGDVERDVNAGLAADPVTAPLKLTVTAKRGTVHLSGETVNTAQQERAQQIARSVGGVSRVIPELRLSDPALSEAVKRALSADDVVGHIPIEVESDRGVVRLRSNATNADERMRAVGVARAVKGVTHVEDHMK